MNDHIERTRAAVARHLPAREPLRVLEAGCGSASWLDLGPRAQVVGIDISAKQLARNPLIHEAIHGDLMTHRFPPAGFDLIVCIDVLEHLTRPDAALANLRDALAPGGLLFLKLPNALSLKGIVTKLTPHRFHVWVYRRFLGRPLAGTEDVGPFKTHMRGSIRPAALRRWAAREGLELVFSEYYEAHAQARLRAKLGPLDHLVRLLEALTRLLSANRLSIARTEYIAIWKRRAAAPENVP